MADPFKSPIEVATQMLADYKTITGTELTVNDLGREEVIKIRNYSIALSAERAELQRILDDFFPPSATTEGLIKHLAARELPTQSQPQRSNGTVQFTIDAVPVNIPIFSIFTKDLDGKKYRTTAAFSTADPGAIGTTNIPAESVDTGQDQNIEVDSGVAFTLDSPITNVQDTITSVAQFRDGRNIETPAEMLDRIQSHDRRRDTGGNLAAYERFAFEADPAVVTAKALDEPRGPGTVDVVITSGTTDIRAAVENGDAITRLPSAALVQIVLDYILTQNPVTDDLEVNAPTEATFDVTFTFDMFDESLRTATEPEIQKEIEIFIYEARPAEVLHPTELERLIDARVGHLLKARRVSDFSGGGPSFTVPNDNILIPGTLTLQVFP